MLKNICNIILFFFSSLVFQFLKAKFYQTLTMQKNCLSEVNTLVDTQFVLVIKGQSFKRKCNLHVMTMKIVTEETPGAKIM